MSSIFNLFPYLFDLQLVCILIHFQSLPPFFKLKFLLSSYNYELLVGTWTSNVYDYKIAGISNTKQFKYFTKLQNCFQNFLLPAFNFHVFVFKNFENIFSKVYWNLRLFNALQLLVFKLFQN